LDLRKNLKENTRNSRGTRKGLDLRKNLKENTRNSRGTRKGLDLRKNLKGKKIRGIAEGPERDWI